MDVDEMQTKLAVWAEDPDFRFDDIYNLLYDGDWLWTAYRSVKSNKGARTPGIDGQTMQDFEEDLGENLESLAKELKSESFDPKPVRRTYIPKGDDEERPLGIPTIKDRIVQEALRMVLEPIYETDFSDYSFGFRPNRSTINALERVDWAIGTPKMSWVIDADIKGFFDNVNHQTLEQIIQNRITDRKMRDLIWEFLKAGIMEEGEFQDSMLGTPQGGIVSPVLANIYLNELDQWAESWTDIEYPETRRRRRRGKGIWEYVRYADDFLFLGNGNKNEAEQMLGRVQNFVNKELELTLSDKKTEIVHAKDGFEFLGYGLVQKTKGREQPKGKLIIPKEAIRDFKGKVKTALRGGTQVSTRSKIMALNALIRGWGEYYKFADRADKVFSSLDQFIWEEMMHWLGKKYKCSVAQVIRNHLENKDPITINGAQLVKLYGRQEYHMEAGAHEKDHPYKSEKAIQRERLPEKEPWLANKEYYGEGWQDQRWKALERDNWKCQECGERLSKESAEVHHKKPRTKYSEPKEAHRLENLESLCHECHIIVEDRKIA